MIEVLFCESEAAFLKAAGKKEDVICLGFLLDIGDIKQPVNSQYRKKLIFSLYALEQRGCGDVMEMEGRQISDAYCHDLERLQNDLSHGVPVRARVRLWYADA